MTIPSGFRLVDFPQRNSIYVPGVKFGILELVAQVAENPVRWKCKCDCGEEPIITIQFLKRERRRGQVSCGCLVGRFRTKTTVTDALLRKRMRNYKQSAQKRGFAFLLTEEQTFALFKGLCHYCQAPPRRIPPSYFTPYQATITLEVDVNGIDRVDPSKDYTVDNTVTCCATCNVAKSDQTLPEFLEWLKKVYRHTQEIYGQPTRDLTRKSAIVSKT